MRIIMLGNSFTFYNDMPNLLARLTGAEVVSHTRGGARLAEQLNPNTQMGSKTLKALREEKWDFVVLQEMSNGPITEKESFLHNTAKLCELIRQNGAVPILYATWAYQRGGKRLADFGMDYDEMYRLLTEAYRRAAANNEALMAEVGTRFYAMADQVALYAEDGYHPNELGSRIAAETIADVIRNQLKHREP